MRSVARPRTTAARAVPNSNVRVRRLRAAVVRFTVFLRGTLVVARAVTRSVAAQASVSLMIPPPPVLVRVTRQLGAAAVVKVPKGPAVLAVWLAATTR